MTLKITLIAVVGSFLSISSIFAKDELQCKSNQKCIKLRDCPYTQKLLTRVLSSSISNREEKNNMILGMRKLVCNPSERSVCCDIEESEAEAEAEGNHEESEAEAEGDHEESDPEAEGDHENSEAEAEVDHEDAEAEGDHEESDPEAEGNHENSEAEAEDDHEESNPETEGDHEESEAEAEGSDHDDQNKITDTLGNFTFHFSSTDFVIKF